MKKFLLLCSLIIFGIHHLWGQKVHYSQDFNSSTDYRTYISADGGFEAIVVNGNTQVNTTNNKLQYIKKVASGTNRGGFTTTEFGPVGFMKLSMEITISSNEGDIASGFMFSIGNAFNTVNAQPNNPNIHTRLVINPTKNPGEFVVVVGNKQSEPFSGTVTLVLYINNTGTPVGYDAPDGSVRAVGDDASDLWVVTQTEQTLAIDEGESVSPNNPLTKIKFSNNPSFTATIDIDDIMIIEEPVVIIPEIVSVAAVPQLTVPMRTSLTYVPFPKELEVTYDNGEKAMAKMSWAPGNIKYNGYISGYYPVVGTIIPNRGTINPLGLKVETVVKVRPDVTITNAFTPDGDGKNDTWVIPDLVHYKKVSIEVFDRDGVSLFHTNNPLEGWDGKNLQGKVLKGSYFYQIQVPEISMIKKGVVTIIKE